VNCDAIDASIARSLPTPSMARVVEHLETLSRLAVCGSCRADLLGALLLAMECAAAWGSAPRKRCCCLLSRKSGCAEQHPLAACSGLVLAGSRQPRLPGWRGT